MTEDIAPPLDELGTARAIAAGDLPSPQKYENVWLFALRITGTGMAYRKSLDEYVWRDGAIYLNDEFLARCNGLAVIWVHPPKSILDSDEYAKRVVGAVMLPYLKDDEVWGVAKIYDDEAAKLLTEGQLSTSPGVAFRDPSVNTVKRLSSGATLLVEGKPSLLDHLAICEQGVWDKAGPPAGVLNESTERVDSMASEGEAALDKARKDAEDKDIRDDADAGKKLDKLLSHLDGMSRRLDAMEMDSKARHDAFEKERADAKRARFDAEHDEWKKADAAECLKDDAEEEADKKRFEEAGETKEVAADKARKDRRDRMDARRKDAFPIKVKKDATEGETKGEEKKEEKELKGEREEKEEGGERADSQARGEIEGLKRQLAALQAMMKPVPDEDRALFADAQARADSVYTGLGLRAPAPMSGETVLAYRTRLLRGVQKHSKTWKEVDLMRVSDAVLSVAQGQIYADAEVAARAPDDLPDGTLREIVRVDPATGQRVVTFVGRHTIFKDMGRRPRRARLNLRAGSN